MHDDGEIPPISGRPVSVIGLILVGQLAILAGVLGALWLVHQVVT